MNMAYDHFLQMKLKYESDTKTFYFKHKYLLWLEISQSNWIEKILNPFGCLAAIFFACDAS